MSLNPKITVNRRAQRSMIIVAGIMEIARDYLSPVDEKYFYHRLSELVNKDGMEIITDDMRKEAGLEPRNENGCTPLELMLIEYYFMSRMLKPIIVQFPPSVRMELIDQNAVWLPRTAPDEGYPKEMIDAGEKYLNERCINKKFELPAMFNWHEFISVLLSAVKG